MSENILAKLTSRKWLKEAISPRAKNFVNSLTFTPVVTEREVAGEKYLFYIGSVTGKTWYSSKTDLSIEMSFIKREMIKPGDVVIECGAHHGAQTILLSRWVGSKGKVIVIEPIPENIAILQRNVKLNGLTNVIVVEKAAGSSCGYLSMTRNSNGAVSSRKNQRNIIRVESITLDKLADELMISPTFIKIDVEGYEYQILEGCKSILSAMPSVFLEVHTLTLPRYGRVFQDLWELIDHKLYDIFIQADDLEEPVRYSPEVVPKNRVHLFFKPR
jgi:FkbM family methyltransferase